MELRSSSYNAGERLALPAQAAARGARRIERMFAPLPDKPDHDALERAILDLWERERTFEQLRELNRSGPTFSFFDGPVTANKSLAVHTAWGRTLKDVFQRYKALRGHHQRYQNGFDCQGLWIEVGVERALGLNSKREIEEFGLAEFARRCREVVVQSSQELTQGSIRLGQWMDWGNDYYTFSDTNIEYIWRFLAIVHEKGWLTKGHRSTEWCPRCGTSISAHELHGHYEDRIDPSLYVRFPLLDRDGEWIMIWTTTPWTLPANVAAAVNPEAEYGLLENGEWVGVALFPDERFTRTVKGAELVGLRYGGPVRHARARLRGRASRDSVGRHCSRHGHRHRPHRPGLRQRGLRALQGARSADAHARRRGRSLLSRLRLVARPLDDGGGRADRGRPLRPCAARPGRGRTSTVIRSAGGAIRR